MIDTHKDDTYRALLRRLRPSIGGAAGLSAVINLLMLTGSVYMLQVYDRVLASGSVPTLVALFGIVILLHAFLAFYDGLRMRLLSRLALRLDAGLAGNAFRHDLNAARDSAAGGTAGRDLEVLRGFISGPAMLALFDLPFTLLFLAVLFVIHPLLGWLTLGGMGLAAILALINSLVLKRPMAAAQTGEVAQKRLADSALRAAPLLTALGMTAAITGRWMQLHQRTLAHQQRGTEPSEVLTALSRSLRMLLQSTLLTAGAWLVIEGAISAGAIVAASILSGRALAPVDQLIGQWRNIVSVSAAHRRLGRTLDSTEPSFSPVELPKITGALEIVGLARLAPPRAGQTERPRILDDISFNLAPGEGLGIVGASASGKSTLARLIVGAIAPDAGDIRFDGATARQWDADKLGRQIGYLPQRVDLLPGTVRDNIARFDPDARDSDVIQAASIAGVHDMILRLPDGYATDLGQADLPLSGGQIQRIGLARALYGNPRLLVLDEPNAHLDIAGEAALTRALTGLRATGVTVIVMAHRAGALAAVDRLMVLQNGRIVQDGPKDTVLSVLGTPTAGTINAGNVSARITSRSPSGPRTVTIPATPAPTATPAAEHKPFGKVVFRAHPRLHPKIVGRP